MLFIFLFFLLSFNFWLVYLQCDEYEYLNWGERKKKQSKEAAIDCIAFNFRHPSQKRCMSSLFATGRKRTLLEGCSCRRWLHVTHPRYADQWGEWIFQNIYKPRLIKYTIHSSDFLFNETDTLSKDHVACMHYLCFHPNTEELYLTLIFWLQHTIYI